MKAVAGKGASVKDRAFLLSKHFIGLALIANLIAWPLASLALHLWLQGVCVPGRFQLVGVCASRDGCAADSTGAVSLLTIKAATNNPVKMLRSE